MAMAPATPVYDVIVVGGGAAGLPAAAFAARRGGKVLLIDAAEKLGGTVPLSTGQVSAAGTSRQKEKGIPDSPENHFKDILRISHGTGRQDLIRLAVDNAKDTFEWLLTTGWTPIPEAPVIHPGHEAYNLPRTYWAQNQGKDLAAALVGEVEALTREGKIEVRLNTRMTKLVADGTRVSGLEAATQDGPQTFAAKNIVLASGGYARNPELSEELHGFYVRGWANDQSLGDGHKAARAIGATIAYAEEFLPTVAGIEDIDNPGKYWVGTLTRPPYRNVWEIFVNTRAKRFMDENSPEVDLRERIVLEQPDLAFWVIYDERIRREAPPLFVWPPEKIARAFENHPEFRKADTLVALAELCGLDHDTLARTVRRYNLAQAAGVRDETGRTFLPVPIAEPPFYAVKHYGISVVTFAGVKTNERLQVLRGDGAPIENLYAAGETLGLGAFGNAYTGGMALMPAMTFGRLLGSQIIAW
jgi:fumarate reductase flavoprotein subunit